MSTKTSNFELIKPELTDAANITAMNENWDKIDQGLANAEEKSFFVTFTGTASSGFASDKTLSEIREAYNAGQRVHAKDSEGRVYTLVDISSLYAQFTSVKASSIASVLVIYDGSIDVAIPDIPSYSYGTTDLTAGTSELETGELYFVYE